MSCPNCALLSERAEQNAHLMRKLEDVAAKAWSFGVHWVNKKSGVSIMYKAMTDAFEELEKVRRSARQAPEGERGSRLASADDTGPRNGGDLNCVSTGETARSPGPSDSSWSAQANDPICTGCNQPVKFESKMTCGCTATQVCQRCEGRQHVVVRGEDHARVVDCPVCVTSNASRETK